MFVVARLGVLLLTMAAGAAAVLPMDLGRRATGRDRVPWPTRATSAALALSMAGGVTALGVLALAFLAEDWRFATVVGHARPDVAWALRIAAIWAGPEGSLLLWTTMLAGAALLVTRLASTSLPGRILAATTAAYGVVVLTEADPFERLAAPPGAGNGLQPVLEHPAMVWHPPVLYLGLIAMLVPAALSIDLRAAEGSSAARTIDGRTSGPRDAIGWTLPLALALLTAGLATGANWAHVELGWGGYWAWDPIENAGLVAWLSEASLLHRLDPDRSAGLAEPGARSSRVVALTAVVPGIAVVWATTITRTGLLNSVHAFADRPALRMMLVSIAVFFTAAMVALAVGRRPDAREIRLRPTARSWAGFGVVGLAAVVVAVGTYEPAVERLVRDDSFVTTGRFYTLLLWPVAVVGAVLRVRAVVQRSPSDATVRVLAAAVIAAVVAMVIVTAATGPTGLVLAAAGGAVAGTALVEPDTIPVGGRSRLAHAGVGLLMIGVAGTTATVVETVVTFTDTEAVTSLGTVTHHGVEIVDGDGTAEAVATVTITSEDNARTFHPKLVSYVTTGGQSTEVDTDRGWSADVQVVLVDADADRASYRISRHPRISLVWAGAALTTLGLGTTAVARRKDTRPRTDLAPAVS